MYGTRCRIRIIKTDAVFGADEAAEAVLSFGVVVVAVVLSVPAVIQIPHDKTK